MDNEETMGNQRSHAEMKHEDRGLTKQDMKNMKMATTAMVKTTTDKLLPL